MSLDARVEICSRERGGEAASVETEESKPPRFLKRDEDSSPTPPELIAAARKEEIAGRRRVARHASHASCLPSLAKRASHLTLELLGKLTDQPRAKLAQARV